MEVNEVFVFIIKFGLVLMLFTACLVVSLMFVMLLYDFTVDRLDGFSRVINILFSRIHKSITSPFLKLKKKLEDK